MGDYEKEQARLIRLWEEIQDDDDDEEVACDNEEELATEEDITNPRDTDSESEQEATSDSTADENVNLERGSLEQTPIFIGKDGNTMWKKHCPSKRIKTRKENLIRHLPGVKQMAKNAKLPLECWELFFSPEMLENIVKNTNLYIRNLADNYRRERCARPTDVTEIKALFGLLYLAGCLKSSRVNTDELWDRTGTGAERFWATMSQQRFLFLLRCLRFDDLATRDERKQIDKLAPIRDIFDAFLNNCKSAYTIGEYATIDEKLEAFRGRCGFKQYIPSKPNKYGIKIFALVDSRTCYASNLEVYVGQQPDGPFCVKNDAESIVLRLVSPLFGTNRNLTCDNWFTSYHLVKTLKEHQITFVGTMKKNKRELPPEFVNTRARPLFSSMFGYQEDMTIVSYVPRKYRNVVLISSLHHDDTIDISTAEAAKPEIITFYNATKGGVDNLDKLCATYDVARNTRRWPMVIFYALLNMAGVNSQIIFAANNVSIPKIKRRAFIKQLSLALTQEHLQRRSLEKNVPPQVRERRQDVAGTSQQQATLNVNVTSSRKRCHFCHSDSKTKYFCKQCKKFVCLPHATVVCPDCAKTFKYSVYYLSIHS